MIQIYKKKEKENECPPKKCAKFNVDRDDIYGFPHPPP